MIPNPNPALGRRLYEEIYAVVCQIPPGKVATYGQIARIVGRCTPRMVGYAMAGTPDNSGVPWQRVINSQGKISERAGAGKQRQLLEGEGIIFDAKDRIDLKKYGWSGKDEDIPQQPSLF